MLLIQEVRPHHVTDDPLLGIDTTPPSVSINEPGQDTYRTTSPPPTVKKPGQETHLCRPVLLPPQVYYLPLIPYYVLPPNPVSGSFYIHGQGADDARSTHREREVLHHSASAASGFLQI